MEESKIDEYARNLAQLLALTADKTYRQVFTIDKNENDFIVVIAVRTNQRGRKVLEKFSEGVITKAVAGPYGQPCPMCNGTGKILI